MSQSTACWMSSISPSRQWLESADDAIVHQRTDVLVLPRVHRQGRIEEALLLIAEIRRSRTVSALVFSRTPKRWNGDLSTSGAAVRAWPQRMAARKIASTLCSVEISTCASARTRS